ncbi:MAG: sugar ABC transporter permease [Desulfomonilaceae bacterium]|nr:sugar ABC transporter permease [Desulfomonilaceae bacterium]
MSMRKAYSESLTGYLFLTPLLLIIVVFSLYPVVYSLFLSLHRIILSLPSLGETFVGIDNFVAFFTDPVGRNSLMVTLVFVGVSTALEICLGIMIALIIHESFRCRSVVRAAILVPWAIPTVIASQMWRFAFNDQYGIANYLVYGTNVAHYDAWLASPVSALAVIILADVWKTSSFAALIILAGLQTIPDELYEASKIDGAGAFQRFFKITLPLLKPAILVALLFRTMDAFRVFDLVFVMTQGGPGDATNVLQFYGYRKLFAEGMVGYGSAVSIVVFLLVFSVSIIYLKFIGTGILEKKEARA